MALKKTLPNPHSNGGNHTDAYSVIDWMEYNKKSRVVRYYIDSYLSKGDRDARVTPFAKELVITSHEDFDEYFGDAKLKPVNKTPIERAYIHAKTKDNWSDAEEA